MDSSDSSRSLSGISLPQWMKSKISDRYDLDQSTFSPPTEDDSFFFIRYPKAKSVDPPTIKTTQTNEIEYHAFNVSDALRNHTPPCRQFIPQAKTTPHELGLQKAVDPPLGRIKSTGTDDGFKGEGAACGHSVVAVAHQMISGKLHKTGKSHSDDENAPKVTTSGVTRHRRNSKSLPASPRGSPKLVRRNPYFTNILIGSSEALETSSVIPNKTGWLTGVVLGVKDSQEDLHTVNEDHHRLSDIEDPLDSPPPTSKGATYKVKPSELREMNFWSPTSM